MSRIVIIETVELKTKSTNKCHERISLKHNGTEKKNKKQQTECSPMSTCYGKMQCNRLSAMNDGMKRSSERSNKQQKQIN